MKKNAAEQQRRALAELRKLPWSAPELDPQALARVALTAEPPRVGFAEVARTLSWLVAGAAAVLVLVLWRAPEPSSSSDLSAPEELAAVLWLEEVPHD